MNSISLRNIFFLLLCCFVLNGCGTKIAKKIGFTHGDRGLEIEDDKNLVKPIFLEEDIEKIKK